MLWKPSDQNLKDSLVAVKKINEYINLRHQTEELTVLNDQQKKENIFIRIIKREGGKRIGLLKFVIESIQIPKLMEDSYVKLQYQKTQFSTDRHNRSDNPKWNNTLFLKYYHWMNPMIIL